MDNLLSEAELMGNWKEDDLPLVSVNCITYNHEKYIKDSIDSFLMQKTNFKYEILIHDDASTDRTQGIIKDYQKRYPNIIKPILQTENQMSRGVKKVSYIFNHKRAIGKYVAVCEGDDYWTDPYKLQKQVDILESNPESVAAFHKVEKITTDKKSLNQFFEPDNVKVKYYLEDIIHFKGKIIHASSLIYKKKYFENPPDFYFKSPVGDLPMMLVLSAQGPFYYLDMIMSNYRVGVPNGAVQRLLTDKKKIIKARKDFIDIYDEFNISTKKKFNGDIEQVKEYANFEINLVSCNLKELKTIRFNHYYKKLNNKRKVSLYLGYYSPNTLIWLNKMKNWVKS